jgi:hypothetical protein
VRIIPTAKQKYLERIDLQLASSLARCDSLIKNGPRHRGIFEAIGRFWGWCSSPAFTNDGPHCIVISSEPDGLKAFVRLYGLHLRVDFGPKKTDFSPFGVICEINGSGMREASSEEVVTALHEVSGMPFSHPWKKPLRTSESPSL